MREGKELTDAEWNDLLEQDVQRVRSLDQRDVAKALVRNIKERIYQDFEQKIGAPEPWITPVNVGFLLEYVETILDLELERITLELKERYIFPPGHGRREALK